LETLQEQSAMRKTKTYFEQIPVQKVKEMIVGVEKQQDAQIAHGAQPILRCRMCRQPVLIETAKTDGDGQAIHEDCYLTSLTQKSMAAKNRRTQLLV
jgi:hypothetical protein